MKILLLTTHVNLGGIGVYVLSLTKGLVRRGHQVFVASSGGDLVPLLESCGATHLTVNLKTKSELSPKVILAQKLLLQIIKEKNIEVLHAHTRVTQVLAHLVSRKSGLPYVTTCHGFFKPRMFRKIFPCWGDHCIAISEAVREHLVNDLGVEKDKITVVHNGVEIERFSSDNFSQADKERLKKAYGLKTETPVIGTIARLSSVKGQYYLILALKKILKFVPEVKLLLVGDGAEKERLINQVKQLGIEDNVRFSPSTFNTALPLSIMDVFVFPSVSEGLGLAIIEAQAMGLPVVASDVGGIYTLVKDGSNGFLVPPKDPKAIAEAILKLLQDKDQALEFGREAKILARENFDLRKMAEGIEGVYKQVLKR